MKQVLKWLRNLFHKEEIEVEADYPQEFIIIDLNPEAKAKGLRGDINKIIYYYKYGWEQPRKFLYSRAILKGLVEMRNIPYIDISKEQEEVQIIEEVRPDLMEYEP